MGHGDLLFHITVGGLGCRAPGGQPGRRAGHPGAPRQGRRTRLLFVHVRTSPSELLYVLV